MAGAPRQDVANSPLLRPLPGASPMTRRLVLASAATLALAPALLAQQFTYNAAAIPVGPNIWADGVAIADLNGDGSNDLVFADGGNYASGSAVVQRMYSNNGAGV